MEEKMLNADALGYLDEAMFTSSLISKKEREAKETDWKNVYPRTKAETEQMESLLQKANAVVEDATNQEYSERYKALRKQLKERYAELLDFILIDPEKTGREFTAMRAALRGLAKLTEETAGKEVIALPIEATALGNLKIQMKNGGKEA